MAYQGYFKTNYGVQTGAAIMSGLMSAYNRNMQMQADIKRAEFQVGRMKKADALAERRFGMETERFEEQKKESGLNRERQERRDQFDYVTKRGILEDAINQERDRIERTGDENTSYLEGLEGRLAEYDRLMGGNRVVMGDKTSLGKAPVSPESADTADDGLMPRTSGPALEGIKPPAEKLFKETPERLRFLSEDRPTPEGVDPSRIEDATSDAIRAAAEEVAADAQEGQTPLKKKPQFKLEKTGTGKIYFKNQWGGEDRDVKEIRPGVYRPSSLVDIEKETDLKPELSGMDSKGKTTEDHIRAKVLPETTKAINAIPAKQRNNIQDIERYIDDIVIDVESDASIAAAPGQEVSNFTKEQQIRFVYYNVAQAINNSELNADQKEVAMKHLLSKAPYHSDLLYRDQVIPLVLEKANVSNLWQGFDSEVRKTLGDLAWIVAGGWDFIEGGSAKRKGLSEWRQISFKPEEKIEAKQKAKEFLMDAVIKGGTAELITARAKHDESDQQILDVFYAYNFDKYKNVQEVPNKMIEGMNARHVYEEGWKIVEDDLNGYVETQIDRGLKGRKDQTIGRLFGEGIFKGVGWLAKRDKEQSHELLDIPEPEEDSAVGKGQGMLHRIVGKKKSKPSGLNWMGKTVKPARMRGLGRF